MRGETISGKIETEKRKENIKFIYRTGRMGDRERDFDGMKFHDLRRRNLRIGRS